MSFKVAVVGSGPSGSTAARVLTEAGIQVDMYDIGTDVSMVKGSLSEEKKGGLIPRKTLFGSGFMYWRQDALKIDPSKNVSFDTSHAKGGLSTVWGATVGLTTAHDIRDWPVDIETITEHLIRVFGNMSLSTRRDQIDIIYPTALAANDLPYENLQSRHILEMADRNAAHLNAEGIYIGKAKLAIDSQPGSASACVLCGKCMIGCEQGSIFNAWNTVELLKAQPSFTYLENRIVKTFSEKDDGVELNFINSMTSEQGSVKYDAVMLAAGCIDSTKIVDASLRWTGHTYQIQDSQKYYFPAWVGRGGHSASHRSISLAHLYIQSFDSNRNVVHGQLYPGKHIFKTVCEHLLGRAGRILAWVLSPLLNRFFVGVSYFSSAVSGRMEIRFDQANGMKVSGKNNPRSDAEYQCFISKLWHQRKRTGFTPLLGVRLRSKLGHSQHFGGTLPMRVEPKKYESDQYGRPFGCKAVYVVDSSVLPSIPGTPTTGLTMANASRIATYLSKLALRGYIHEKKNL